MVIYGVHIEENPKELLNEIDRIEKLGGRIIQTFVKTEEEYKDTYHVANEVLKAKKMLCIVHASYTINLATEWDEYSWWVKQFLLEIEMAHIIGAFGIIIHMGKQLGQSIGQAYNNMYSSLLYIHNKIRKYPIKILLETATGQGSEIAFKLEDYTYFIKKFIQNKHKSIRDRFRICLDTCHIFEAGYDIRTKATVQMFLDTFEELIGIKYIALLHLNDSKNDIGLHVDRHASLGKGYIGKKGLMIICEFFQHLNVPIILETPEKYHKEEINTYLHKH